MTVTYRSMNETDTVIAKIDGGSRFEFITDADGPLQAEYQAWLDDGNTLEPYAPPPLHVPDQISDRQFFQQAAISQIITEDEALAAVATGAIPAVLQTIVDGISDPAQRFAAKMLLSGATVFDRHNPLTESVGAALGWTSAQIDQFFIDAGVL